MDFFMRFCVSLFSIVLFLLAGCGKESVADYGFSITKVIVTPAYQSLNIQLQQNLSLSQQANEALEHGVTLNIMLEMELINETDFIAMKRDTRHFQLRYLPMSERFQLSDESTGESRTFSRLRHMLAVFNDLKVKLSAGPLLPGHYELRTRVSLDERRLPTPMQLPAWFSSQWHHDSEWSVWPFEVNA